MNFNNSRIILCCLLYAVISIYSIDCNFQPIKGKQSRDSINDKEQRDEALRWICPFTETIKTVNKSENWYKFLNSLFCKFSRYEIQSARRSYKIDHNGDSGKDVCKIEDFIDNKGQVIDINERNYKIFLNKILKCNIAKLNNTEDVTFTELQLEELNHVLNLTLKDSVYVNCEGSSLFVKGNYITTGDLRDILYLKHNDIDVGCKDLLSSNKSKSVNVFALNTFFVDVNINSSLTKNFTIKQINVISPKWENIGKNTIELKGEDGELPTPSSGIDGKPGKPGKPGGNFFGIGYEFTNGANLTIFVDGGNGGRGEDGKNGNKGVDGDTPPVPRGSRSNPRCDDTSKIGAFKYEKLSCIYRPTTDLDHQYCEYKIFGKDGAKGNKGGNGGKGGKGGNPGNILIYGLKGDNGIAQSKNNGSDGINGKGGRGGIGGKRGNDIIVSCFTEFWEDLWQLRNTIQSNVIAASGENGIDGGNTKEMDVPKEAAVIDKESTAKIINDYKYYLRENLNDRFTYFSRVQFYKHLDNDTKVKSFYDTLGLTDELRGLEEQFIRLNNLINFLPFYQSLLKRVNEYAKSPTENENLNQYRIVLGYLYTAILSRIHNLKDNSESNLIIDINTYFKSVKLDIDKLKDMKSAKNKEILINKYKDDYKKGINAKIEEAKELISKEILPQINNIGDGIESQMESLVNEVIALEKQALKEHDELIKKQKKLEKTLVLQGIFSSFKIFGEVVSFLGPVGEIAGSVIAVGSTVAESFISGDTVEPKSAFQLPQSVSEIQSIKGSVTNITERRISRLKNALEFVSQEMAKHPDILGNMSVKITNIRYRLGNISQNAYNFTEIEVLQSELDMTLQTQEESNKGNTKKLNVIKNLKGIVQLITTMGEIYNKLKTDREQLDAISNAIIQNEEKFKMLKQYEQKIYNTLIPMLQNIQLDLQDIISKLGKKSEVALDITKWQVSSTLRDLALFMKQQTKGFNVQDDLQRSIEKLEDAMYTIINVHKHIQDYQKDQNLATFISKISTISISDINIADNRNIQEALRQAVRDLEINIRSNIVIERYKVAMHALKQFVFPFAHTYFKDLMLPSHLQLNSDKGNITLDNLVTRASTEIEKVNSKLEEYKYTVAKHDKCIGKGIFKSGYISGKPFFVWENAQHKNLISKLLSGEVVIVDANIRNSAFAKDAIKFNIINFHFKLKNETLQTEIDNKLKGFQITATHLGNSYYRYENKVYEMETVSQEIWYYFEKGPDGEPKDYSISYMKIKNGNVSLSPYASWKIKLDNLTKEISFKDLEIYKDLVDLELEGKGYYINKLIRNCTDLMVDNYYKAIREYSLEDLIKSFNPLDYLHALRETFLKYLNMKVMKFNNI